MAEPLLQPDAAGLYCPAGSFHVDPWLPVHTAVLTHAHADHARPGSGVYFCAQPSEPLLRVRLGPGAVLRPIPYGEVFRLGRTRVSFHPAGHILGSAQVRVEAGPPGASEVWVASGDYKRDPDPTCAPFEVVPCDVFITEATFALPIYRWEPPSHTARRLLDWWDQCAAQDKACVLFGYSLGKVQRAMAELLAAARSRGRTVGPIYLHGAAAALTEAYRRLGVELPPAQVMPEKTRRGIFGGSMTFAPPAAAGSPWMRRFGPDDRYQTACASGWANPRGARRRDGHDRAFSLSDHADWPSLLRTIRQTGASRVLVTHGNIDSFVRYLRETGASADPLRTAYGAGED